jgi:iron complex outermembrane receptor protein
MAKAENRGEIQMGFRYISRMLLASGVALTAMQAHAQTATPAAAGEAVTGGIEDIVVTAQKRAERVQDVPIAITALSADTIERTGIRSTADLNVATPGLNITSFSGSLLISLRGIGTTNPQIGNENSVALYVDGAYIPSLRGSVFSLNNIERIEVLKGPQGTLFGRNATGGAVQIITKDPSIKPTLEASAGYESYRTVNLKLYASAGLTDNLAIDFAGYYHKQHKNLGVNVATGNGIGRGEEYDFRSKIKWTGEDTTITASAAYLHVKDSAGYTYSRYPNSPYGAGAGFLGTTKPYDTGNNADPMGKSVSRIGTLNITHDFDAFRVVSVTALSKTTGFYLLDSDQTPTNLSSGFLPAKEVAQSQEIQIVSPASSKLKLILGGYYFHDHSQFTVNLSGAAFPATQVRHTDQFLESKALFGQASYPIFEDTNLTLGARYTWDTVRFQGFCSNNVGVITLKQCSALYPEPGTGTTIVQNTRSKNSQPSWRASLDHKFSPDVMAYISYNRGYKSAGYNLSSAPTDPANVAQPKTPKPETLSAYEIGLKMQTSDRRLRINPSLFYYDYRSLQVLVNQGGIAFQDNAPKARIYGLDLDGEAAPTDQLHINFGLSVQKSEFVTWPNSVCYTPRTVAPYGNVTSVCNVKGNRLPRVPNFTGNLGFTYDIPVGAGKVTLGVNGYLNGGFYWHPDNRLKQKSYEIINGDIAWYPNEMFRVRVYGRNLTNNQYVVNAQESTFGDYRNSAAPRTIGVEVGVKF